VTSGLPVTPARRLAWASVLLAVALAALIGWVAAHHGRPLAWDLALHAAAVGHRTPALTTAAIAVTTTAEGFAYIVAAVGGLLALRPWPWWLGALVGIVVLAVGQLLRVGLAVWIGRARPPVSDWVRAAGGFALPSGHTTTATLAAGLLGLGLIRALRGARRVAWVALAAGWAVAVGLTRVYLGVHWPTDVLGGWLFGALLTVLAAGLFGALRGRGWSGLLAAQRAEEEREGGQLQDGHDRDQGGHRPGRERPGQRAAADGGDPLHRGEHPVAGGPAAGRNELGDQGLDGGVLQAGGGAPDEHAQDGEADLVGERQRRDGGDQNR
jgi:undecaprenyl-diphosphatase